MDGQFHQILANLRRKSGKSQRQVASDLGVSQALISHYEKGVREPGLQFVCRACDYYGVTADYLLGRARMDGAVPAVEVQALADRLQALSEQTQALLQDAR